MRLNILNIKTKMGKKITLKDIRKAINIMENKHIRCRWKITNIASKRSYILIEGYYWLRYVYFNNEKRLIDADISFFEKRIKSYEELLKIETKKLFEKDMTIKELIDFFNRQEETVKKAIFKMIKDNKNYRYKINEEYLITKEGVEWLSKYCFKSKYLELLEDYKMELTEKYIIAGYIYDNFLN